MSEYSPDLAGASFDLAAVEAAVAGTDFAGSLTHLRSTASTNTLALEAAQAGADRGVWIADEQTAGRGRGGHTWHSTPGDGLYVSALVTPALPLTTALRLSLATGLAAQTAIASSTGLAVDLRWPNDLLLHGRKVGGILVETAATHAPTHGLSMLRYAVIGVGINCNHLTFPSDLDPVATSLRRELRPVLPLIPRDLLLGDLLCALDREIHLLVDEWTGAQARGSLNARFAKASSWVAGKRVHVAEDGGYTGLTAGLTPEGFLRINAGDGSTRIVRSGGVREMGSPQP